MQSKLATFILSTVFILIAIVFIMFGMIIWDSLAKLETSVQPQNTTTIISENSNTIDQDIKAPGIIEDPFEGLRENREQQDRIDYSNITVNKYYYNQLEDYSKTIYKAFENRKL